jgi:MFS-type transporter involved in bile tolerance (Atg22 family)
VPILLEVLASHNAYQADHITPCQPQQGDQECVISIGSIWISTTVFPFCIMAIGLILQMLLILGLGGLVDRSIHHRRFLLVASLLGAMMSILTASVVSASMLVPATVVVIINCLFSGMFAVFYDAYLPILARLYLSHPRIKPHSNSTTMYHKIDRIYSLISGHGMAIGYASGALLLTSIIILIYRLDDVIYA